MDERESRKLITGTNITLLLAFGFFIGCVFLTLFITTTFGPFTALTTLTISTIIQELIALIIPVIIFVRFKRFNFSKYLRLKPVKANMCIRIFFLAVAGYLFITCFIVLWNMIFGTNFSYAPTLEDYISNDFIGTAGLILNVAVFAAIAEELLFRGVLLRGLQPIGNFKAVMLSAFAFAVFHLSFYRLGYTFMLGIFMGYIALITDNLLYAMLYHLLHNTFAIFIDITYLVQNASSSIDKTSQAFVYIGILLIATLFLVTIFISIKDRAKKQREAERIRKEELEEKLVLKNSEEFKTEPFEPLEQEEADCEQEEVEQKKGMKNHELTELLYLRDVFCEEEYLEPLKVKFYFKGMIPYAVYIIIATCIIITRAISL